MNKILAAVEYFEDAVRESDEFIKECHPSLRESLEEQKGHFVIAVEALRMALLHKGTVAVCRMALETWGAQAQTEMVFEEMAELQKELCKHDRGRDNTTEIAEEIADVQIMLEQMILLHGCGEAVKTFRAEKLKRLTDRITSAGAGTQEETKEEK